MNKRGESVGSTFEVDVVIANMIVTRTSEGGDLLGERKSRVKDEAKVFLQMQLIRLVVQGAKKELD